MAEWKFNLVCLAFILLWSSTCFVQGSSFGQSCNDTKKCDKKAWLTCRNGTCQCMKPDVTMYDNSLGKCATKAGENCKLDNSDSVLKMMSCTKNSKCSAEGVCLCEHKFYENVNGACTLAKSHMETCDSLAKCSSYKGLQCTDGLCKCNETVSTYYSNEEGPGGQCVGLAGESCINSQCVEFAACSSGNKCVCNASYYQDDEKECVEKKGLLGNCTKNEECMKHGEAQFLCLEGVCTCDPTNSLYGTARRTTRNNWLYGYGTSESFEGGPITQCLGLAGSPCLESLCVKDAFCDFHKKEYYKNDNSGTCRCIEEFTMSKRGSCAKGYETYCGSSLDCIDGLVCGGHGNQTCRCPYVDQDFDNSTSTCVSKVDGPCNSLVSCVTNSECVLFSKGPLEAGHCSCKKGYIKNGQGTCDLAFGSPCTLSSNDTSCDTVAGLECLNFKCQCNSFAKYSEKYRKCLGLVGAMCDFNSSESQCVENSRCERVHPRLQGICTCPTGTESRSGAGFKETPQYTCEIMNQDSKTSPIHDEE